MDSSVHTFTTNNTYYIMLARKEWMSVVEKLDARFLPDEVMLPSDWSENDPDSPYYINNRTHYIETTSSELCVIDTLEFSEYQTRENGEVIYSSSGTNESLVFDVNKTYVVQWPDSWCGVIPYEYNGMVCVGSEYLYDESAHDSGEGFFITTDGVGGYTAYCLSSDTINGLIIESETTSVQQLDEMFIPDSIARVDDIPSLDGYATEEFVSTAIDELAGGNGATIQYIATITTNWTGDAAPYTQEIAVEGILEGDDPIVDLVLSDDYATSQVQLEEWKKVYRITTSDNLITVYAEESILINLSIQLLVSRDKVIDVGTVGRDSIIDEAVTAQKIAKESRTQYFSAALNVENWVGDVAPYSQTVAVEGLLESDRPKVYLDIPDDFDAVETQQTAFSLLYDVDTADGSVTFKAKDMPSTTFGVTLEVARI